MNTYTNNMLKDYGINPEQYAEDDREEILSYLEEYEAAKAEADSYREALATGTATNYNHNHDYLNFLQGMADRQIIALQRDWNIKTNIEIPTEL